MQENNFFVTEWIINHDELEGKTLYDKFLNTVGNLVA